MAWLLCPGTAFDSDPRSVFLFSELLRLGRYWNKLRKRRRDERELEAKLNRDGYDGLSGSQVCVS